jgi:hypothetical protein
MILKLVRPLGDRQLGLGRLLRPRLTTSLIYTARGRMSRRTWKFCKSKAVPADKDDMGQLKCADMKVEAEFCLSSIIAYTKDPAKPRAAESQLVVNK